MGLGRRDVGVRAAPRADVEDPLPVRRGELPGPLPGLGDDDGGPMADLSGDHGYPARVIVPALPGAHNTTWVASIDFRRRQA